MSNGQIIWTGKYEDLIQQSFYNNLSSKIQTEDDGKKKQENKSTDITDNEITQ